MTKDGPSAPGHAHTVSPAMDCGGAAASVAPGKQWRCKWGALGVEGIKAKIMVPQNWMLKLYEGGALEWLEIGHKMTGDGEKSKLELSITWLWQRASLAHS